MAKKKSTFDPDALAKAGEEIVKKHQVRENVEPKPKTRSEGNKRGPKSEEKTQLCRVGISYHKRLKLAALMNGQSMRQYLEQLIDENTPKS